MPQIQPYSEGPGGPLPPLRRGAAVWARWHNDVWYRAAFLAHTTAGHLRVRYDLDGVEQNLDASRVMPVAHTPTDGIYDIEVVTNSRWLRGAVAWLGTQPPTPRHTNEGLRRILRAAGVSHLEVASGGRYIGCVTPHPVSPPCTASSPTPR